MHSHLLHYVIKLNGPGPNTTLGYSHFYSPSPLIPLTLLVSFRYYHCRHCRHRLLSTHYGALSGAILASVSQWALTLHQWPRKLPMVIVENLVSWQLDSAACDVYFANWQKTKKWSSQRHMILSRTFDKYTILQKLCYTFNFIFIILYLFPYRTIFI